MPQYKVSAGTFHVRGFQPDGDSIRFQANNQVNWDFFTQMSGENKLNKTKRGIWSICRTSDFSLWDVRMLQEDILILPKLFRRLVGFIDHFSDFDKLGDYMKKQRDNLQLWDGTKKRSLADLMKIDGRRMQMQTPVEDILFAPK